MGRKKPEIELIARGAILRKGRILLAHKIGAANTFLPGGHVEWGEPARSALRRELIEELGADLRIGAFLGVVEHAFGLGKRRTHEVNFLFLASGRSISDRVVSREPDLEFFWQPLSRLKAARLQPHPLQRLLPGMIKSKTPAWAGTLE